jgi:hypothetical protein
MNTNTVRRLAARLQGQDRPLRGPRTRDNRAADRRQTQELIDAYTHGYTDEMED